MLEDFLIACGVLAPLFYVVVTVMGGHLRPGYSHIRDTVSELFSPGSPNKKILNVLILSYAVFTALFGVGMWLFVSDIDQAITLGIVSSMFMILVGIINLLTGFVFLQDPMGKKMTFSGKMHIALVSFMALLSIAIPVSFGIWLIKTDVSVSFGVYSLISSGLLLIIGISNPIVAKLDKPLLGLMERLTIAAFLQWSVAISIFLLTHR